MREKRKDPEFLEKERERDEIRKKNIKIQKQLNSMFNLEENDDDCFKKDYLEANNHCDLNRMQNLFTETDNKVKNVKGYNFRKLLDN